eukprot:365595-Chlamydomonas_euryale.AAC.10
MVPPFAAVAATDAAAPAAAAAVAKAVPAAVAVAAKTVAAAAVVASDVNKRGCILTAATPRASRPPPR